MTLRELAEMANGRLRAEWAQAAEVLALIYYITRPAKTTAIPAWKCNPFGKPTVRARAAQIPHKEAWSMFKSYFDRGVFGGQSR